MTAFVGAVFLVVAAVWLVLALKAPARVHDVLTVSRQGMAFMQNKALSDDEKEAFLQKQSLRLFRLSFLIVIIFSVALAAPTAALWALGKLGVLSFDDVIRMSISVKFLVGCTVAGTLIALVVRRRKAWSVWEHQYSFVDRVLHRLAFATWPIQTALADTEQVTFKKILDPVRIDRPVFVAGLPRAGTTLVLQLIEDVGEFASYKYMDMPFLLCPLLWSQLSGASKRSVGVRERAHGDGVSIGLESPEAFEEVVWRAFWSKRYGDTRIRPWTERRDEEFEIFFKLQMRKIIALRRKERPSVDRYLSKANGNIARLGLIARMLPEAVLIVPYRDPMAQARSLLTQHRKFLEMHAADPFTREYMAGIGHYDFGANLKPIDFGGWMGEGPLDFTQLDTWVRYWCAAYRALAEMTDTPLYFLSYDRLCLSPEEELAKLERVLGLKTPGALVSQADQVRRESGPPEPLGEGMEEAARVLELIEAREVEWRTSAEAPATASQRP